MPGARVIVLTSFLDDDKLLPALRAGAAGYLLKNAAAAGARARGARGARRRGAARPGRRPPGSSRRSPRGDASRSSRLTPREREVLELIGRGFPNKRIARELGIAEKTVKTHVGHVLAKLGVTDRTQAAVVAVRAGPRRPQQGPRTNCPWRLRPRARRTVRACPVGIVTGASRGLGLALTRALAARRLAPRRRRPRRRSALDAPRSPSLRRRRRVAGDVADARAPARARRGGRARASTCSSTTRACSGRARSRRSPTTRSTSCERVYEVNVLAPLALAQLALPRSPPARAIVNVTSDAAVEPYEGWGGYGSSKAALEQLTAILGAEHPELRVYAVDPGDMRTQMHQEAFPGEDISDRPPPEESVPGLLALIEGTLPERPLPRARRWRGGCRHERARARLRARSRRTSRRRRAGSGATTSRLLVATRARRRARARALRATCRASSSPATCSSSTPPRRCPPRSPRGSATEPVELRLSTPCRAERAGSSSCAPRRGCRCAAPPVGARARAPGRRTRRAARALRGQRPARASRGSSSDSRSSATSGRHGRPIRYGYVPEPWPLEAYQTVFALEPGSAEMPSAGRPFTAELVTELVAAGRPRRAARRCTPASPRPSAASRRTPSATACRRRPRGSSTPCTAGAGASIAVGTTVVRALETVADARRHRRRAGEGWTSLVVTPERGLRAVDGLLTGWHEPQASHLLMLEAAAGERAARALLRRGRSRARLPLARVRRRCT